MNMSAYQKFVRAFQIADESRERASFEEKKKYSDIPMLKKRYARQGITDVDTMLALEERKNSSQSREIKTYLNSCQVFEVDDKHKFLLQLTNNPKDTEEELFNQVRLPFPEIFVDVSFDGEEFGSKGLTAYGILLKEMKQIDLDFDSENKEMIKKPTYGLTAYTSFIDNEGRIFVDRYHFPIVGKKAVYDDRKIAKFIRKFVINFILFLKDREVIYVDNIRGQKNRERRIKNNKMPLPDSKIIKLNGELKRYVNTLNDTDFKGKLSYRFWVRGHWRNYKSDKYKNVKNKVQWINPYKKGKGVEVKHIYDVKPKDNPDVFDYSDIKPLKKPLREMRRK